MVIRPIAFDGSVDAKDFRLLVALHEDARASYRTLGRRVSLSAPAVRDRLRRLEGRGIFQGYMMSVDPSLLDRDELLVFFQGEWTRDGAREALAVADVAWVAWKLDGGLSGRAHGRHAPCPGRRLPQQRAASTPRAVPPVPRNRSRGRHDADCARRQAPGDLVRQRLAEPGDHRLTGSPPPPREGTNREGLIPGATGTEVPTSASPTR